MKLMFRNQDITMANIENNDKRIALETLKEKNRHEEEAKMLKIIENKDKTIHDLTVQLMKTNDIMLSRFKN